MIWVYGYMAIGLLIGFRICWSRWDGIAGKSVDVLGRPPSRGVMTASAVAALITFAVGWLPMLITGFIQMAAEKRRGRR